MNLFYEGGYFAGGDLGGYGDMGWGKIMREVSLARGRMQHRLSVGQRVMPQPHVGRKDHGISLGHDICS